MSGPQSNGKEDAARRQVTKYACVMCSNGMVYVYIMPDDDVDDDVVEKKKRLKYCEGFLPWSRRPLL